MISCVCYVHGMGSGDTFHIFTTLSGLKVLVSIDQNGHVFDLEINVFKEVLNSFI